MPGFDKILSEHEQLCLSMLNHPNINKALNDNTLAYVDGETLHEHIEKAGALSQGAANAMAKPLLEALEHMHSKGVVHRDISPNNIMLSSQGPVLIDFGNASYKGQNPIRSQGTEGCRPPSCFKPDEQYSAQDDLFALAATFYHALHFKRYEQSPELRPVTWCNRDDEQLRATPKCGVGWIDDCLLYSKELRPLSAKDVLEKHFTPSDQNTTHHRFKPAISALLGLVFGSFAGVVIARQLPPNETPTEQPQSIAPKAITKIVQVENPKTQAQLASAIVETRALRIIKRPQTRYKTRIVTKTIKAEPKQESEKKWKLKYRTYEGGRN